MESITININTTNQIFVEQGEQELARILRDLADGIESGAIDEQGAMIHDLNGNLVGTLTIENEEE